MSDRRFLVDDSPGMTNLAAVIEDRARRTRSYSPPLPNAALLARRVVPRLDALEPSLQQVLMEFLAALPEPYPSRWLRPNSSFASPLSRELAGARLEMWLIFGLSNEVALFGAEPDAGFAYTRELLLSLDGSSGDTRFYEVSHLFSMSDSNETLFAVSAERVTMLNVFGTD